MFDKLLDFILNLYHELLPFQVINMWEEGVVMRLGKFKKVVKAGLVFKIPLADKIWCSFLGI